MRTRGRCRQPAPKNGRVLDTFAREGLEDDLPDAFALLDSISFTEERLGKLELAIQKAGEIKGTRTWLKDNRDVVQPWIEAAKKAQKG